MTKIYDQHDKAFNQVSAYVLAVDGVQKGTIAIKHPRDGAGRLYAYVHIHGLEMVRGFAGGYGYDKRSASVQAAASKMKLSGIEGAPFDAIALKFVNALQDIGGADWDRVLTDAGFQVLRAV